MFVTGASANPGPANVSQAPNSYANPGPITNQASNSNASSTLGPVTANLSSTSQIRSTASTSHSGSGSELPDFTKIDSPFIPAGVRNAILKKIRPKPQDREDFVTRIVDHTKDVVVNLERKMFNKIADSIVEKWKESF